MVEEVGPHKVGVALVMILGQAHVLVQVHGMDLGEIQVASFILGNQFLVSTHRAAAGGQTQNAVGLQINLSGNNVGSLAADISIILGNNQSHNNSLSVIHF